MANQIVPASIHIGDTVTNVVFALGKSLSGTVIYIHPKRRFYRVEYTFKGNKMREAYFA